MIDLIIASSPLGRKGHDIFNTESPRLSSIESTATQRDMEAEHLKRYKDKIYMLSDMLIGKAPKRSSANQITMMNKNWGLGIEFASVAKLIFDRALAVGIGHEVPTDWFSQTSHLKKA